MSTTLRLLSPRWSDFLTSLIGDLVPLGYSLALQGDQATIRVDQPAADDEAFWDAAHRRQHCNTISLHIERIRAFEARHADVFARMNRFQPSAVRPVLEIVDFDDRRHRAIVDYLALCQSVRSRKLVGRRMGLLVWDDGQTGNRPLIGAAMLASPRYSQRLRDTYIGWAPHHPKTSVRHDPDATAVREAGLARMMQLSMAYALPPYSLLSGSRLVAIAPFTQHGQDAFAMACRHEADPDLAAIVTTTGKGPSGFPFRAQRVGQLSAGAIAADAGAHGNIFARVKDGAPLLTSFEDLVSARTSRLACELMRLEEPTRFASAARVEKAAMSYCLKRLALTRDIFRGNEIGVHVGVLGPRTRGHLATGTTRPTHERPRLDWDIAVSVWTQRFLPASDGLAEASDARDRAHHREARLRRNAKARTCPQEAVYLSSRLPGP